MSITNSKRSFAKLRTDPIADPIEDSMELIAPTKLPRIFPTIPASKDSTRHSAELRTLLMT